jgi:hypothetical protein
MAPPANPAELRQRITAVVGTDTAPVDRKIEHLSLVIQRHTDDGEKIEYTAVQLKVCTSSVVWMYHADITRCEIS